MRASDSREATWCAPSFPAAQSHFPTSVTVATRLFHGSNPHGHILKVLLQHFFHSLWIKFPQNIAATLLVAVKAVDKTTPASKHELWCALKCTYNWWKKMKWLLHRHWQSHCCLLIAPVDNSIANNISAVLWNLLLPCMSTCSGILTF